jgi:glycosyltransferase involved in cell wall biosynthesis
VRIAVGASAMWSEAIYLNAGISRFGRHLIDTLTSRTSEDSFEVFTQTTFEPPTEWWDRPNLKLERVAPAGSGRKAWDNFGSRRFARPELCDVWLSTHHAIPFRPCVPTVITIHDMVPMVHPEFNDWKRSLFLRFILRHNARKATRILTNSEATKQDIVRLAGVGESKVLVMPLGPGSNLTQPAEASECGMPVVPFARYVFALGTLEPRKNFAGLVRAFAKASSEPGMEDVGLVVAGARGWKEDAIFEEIERLKMAEKVSFLGYVPDEQLPGLFRKSEAFILPSFFEGFGLPILEAMMAGAPVLTGGHGATRELAGDAGAFFDPADPDDMARCIVEVLQSPPAYREAMRVRGFERSRQYSWERSADVALQAVEEAFALTGRALQSSARSSTVRSRKAA